jgi:SnoaL-like domain
MDDTQAVRELLDRHQIGEVLARRARSADRRDLAAMTRCYHPDATEYHEGFSGNAREYLENHSIVSRPDRQVTLLWHLLGIPLIDLREDTADVETYHLAVVRLVVDDEPRHISIGGRYLDTFTRRDGQWLIAHRAVVFDWSRVEQPTEEYWDLMKFDRATTLLGRFGPDDPSNSGREDGIRVPDPHTPTATTRRDWAPR